MKDLAINELKNSRVYHILELSESSVTFEIPNYIFMVDDLDFGEFMEFDEVASLSARLKVQVPIHSGMLAFGLGTIGIYIPDLDKHARISDSRTGESFLNSLTNQVTSTVRRRLKSNNSNLVPRSEEEAALDKLMDVVSDREITDYLTRSSKLFLNKNGTRLSPEALRGVFLIKAISVFEEEYARRTHSKPDPTSPGPAAGHPNGPGKEGHEAPPGPAGPPAAKAE